MKNIQRRVQTGSVTVLMRDVVDSKQGYEGFVLTFDGRSKRGKNRASNNYVLLSDHHQGFFCLT